MNFTSNNLKALLILLFIGSIGHLLQAQKSFFGDVPHSWENRNIIYKSDAVIKYDSEDVVCLRENVEFVFYSRSDQKLRKNVVFKINSEAGVQKLSAYSLPESFDIAHDAGYNKQGRKARIKTPFIARYKINNFSARKFRNNEWSELLFNVKFDQLKWISLGGEFVNDEITNFQFQDLKVGDIVELYYESEFGSTYGSNLFYFNQKIPKIQSEYKFSYKVEDRFADYAFILPVNIPDSLITSNTESFPKNYKIITKTITLKNLEPMNYPENAMVSNQFPYVFIDFRFYKIISGSYPDGSNRLIEYELIRPRNFEWMIIMDTTNYYTKIYDKQFASIRQFISKLPPITNDSSKTNFVKAFCDTLNSFTYINSNNLFYNRSDIYNLYSGDHLLKRRLVEHLVWKVTIDILNENKIQYYRANIQDNRYGEHNMKYRCNYGYENYLVALPANNSFVYFVPRRNGVPYYMNELPYYYEGSIAALNGRNFQKNDKNQQSNYFKLIKTHKGTSNENSRIENTSVRINTDSSIAYLNIKESLSGQFSTILRHYYFNTYIDSTMPTMYFKKCTDKPKAEDVKIKLSSKITEYPFRHNFICSEKIKMESKNQLSMQNWFSFIIPDNITVAPNHDYYFDFENTDAYNFLLNFSKPTEIENLLEFTKNLDNETFSLNSGITKQSERSYLVKVEVKVKTRKLTKTNADSLLGLAKALGELNNFSLKLN